MNILVIGQCTLHWGRMEFGNIGNYYIMEPFFRELHKAFPGADVKTTMQMSARFCTAENLSVLPLDCYYNWREIELELAKEELDIAKDYCVSGKLRQHTPYLDAVLWADLVIDFSGDIWGDNANFLGKDRFAVGLYKDLIAQTLGKKVVMLAGSPGPFSDEATLALAKQVYAGFDLVTNREPVSITLMEPLGFDVSKTHSLACPAFMFEPASGPQMDAMLAAEKLSKTGRNKPIAGFILCGWNFEKGPFDLWPRDDADYEKFAQTIEYMTEELGLEVCLMSHSNGFDVPPATFTLKHGRDYPVTKQLENVLRKRGISTNFFTLDGVYDTWQTKAIIGSFDLLVSGRVHAAVSGLSQQVPTVIIDYGHEPKAHKLLGFATVAGAEQFVADPANLADLQDKVCMCWQNRDEIVAMLGQRIPQVHEQARKSFTLAAGLFV
ncbi:polysaccharide pyruvyl transferase family protein [Rheinheimera baltica]|uniref:polysaccharide pyruvyl transferase family protein n=1 Tax=Rheinheimera baltica TaxID=67576 RepID=UPI00273E8816|nr:polysaccharide pyruvyl transferase family protein [Rheinheimera baltica]MDP5191098.1 polysaccharide pyruvyl transferase family protein [Rheinheimera baltica]